MTFVRAIVRTAALLHGGKWSQPARLGTVVIVATTCAIAAWAALAPLHGAVMAHGLVKTEQNRKAVQHPDGGIIKAIRARDGDRVQAGQPLMELDNIVHNSSQRLLQEMAVYEATKRARLDREQQLDARFLPDPALLARYGAELAQPAYERELRIFQARRTALDQQRSTLEGQLKTIALERTALRRQVEATQHAARLAREELDMNKALVAEQFVSRSRVLTAERALSDYEAKLSEYEATLAQAEQRGNEVGLRMANARTEYQRLAAEEFKESHSRLVELQEKLRPVEDALQRQVITAPVSGRVVGSRFHAPGQVAGPREVLMEVVPDAEDLVLEAQVPVDSIQYLHVGQAAELRFTAFNSRATPSVAGRVSYVSADAMADRQGLPFYQVQVRPDAASMRQSGIAQLQPGMAAEVFILTEGRSVLDYLLAPITDSMQRAMRER